MKWRRRTGKQTTRPPQNRRRIPTDLLQCERSKRVNSGLVLRRDPDSESTLRALGLYRSGHHARRFAFTRRRTDGAGGFFGIDRMSNGRTTLAGGGGAVNPRLAARCRAEAEALLTTHWHLVERVAALVSSESSSSVRDCRRSGAVDQQTTSLPVNRPTNPWARASAASWQSSLAGTPAARRRLNGCARHGHWDRVLTAGQGRSKFSWSILGAGGKIMSRWTLTARLCLVAAAALATAAIAGDLPDPNITPGLADPQMTPDRLCSPGFTTYVTRSVPSARKKAIYKVYGMSPDEAPCPCDVDHLIPLGLGGSNGPRNLWPQSRVTQPWNSLLKDKLEKRMHAEVCDGKIDLEGAQQEIGADWIKAYISRFGQPR
jgi:hypothetical protein